MASMEDHESTLPYFLEHGTRPCEICCIVRNGDIIDIVYMDENNSYMNTLSETIWGAKVTGHYYGTLPVMKSSSDELVKSIEEIPVHYIMVKR